jgi:hypothetical protein
MNHDIMPHVALGLISVLIILWLGAWAHNGWHGNFFGYRPPRDVAMMRTAVAGTASAFLLWLNYWWLRRRMF